MPFPELTQLLSTVLRLRRAEMVCNTIELGRELTPEERDLLSWLLVHGKGNASTFLPQVEGLRVRGKCSCGCPTVDFEVAAGTPPIESETRLLADLSGTVDGNTVGVLLLQTGGHLSCLEVYALGDIPGSFGLPIASALYTWSSKEVSAKAQRVQNPGPDICYT